MTTFPIHAGGARRDQRGGGLSTSAWVAVLVALVLGFGGAGAWRGTGGRWAVVETPSMGQAVPVGSLILTRPRPLDRLVVGDIVTYQPPHLRSIYTHRVVAVDADGTLEVKGDLNGTPDPYPVTQDALVGQVVAHVRGLGWLLRALPTTLGALVVLLGATHLWVGPRWRSGVRVIGTCLTFAVVSLLLRPFVHPLLVATTTVGDGPGTGLRATVVSTGLLPTRITGAGGQHVDLLSGQAGSVPVQAGAPGGPLMITGSAHLTGWWLVGVGAVCLLPLLWCLVVGLAVPSAQDPRGREAGPADGPDADVLDG